MSIDDISNLIKNKWGISNENFTEKLNSTIFKSKSQNNLYNNQNLENIV